MTSPATWDMILIVFIATTGFSLLNFLYTRMRSDQLEKDCKERQEIFMKQQLDYIEERLGKEG